MLLLMEARGDEATVLDFQRIFTDDLYRLALLNDCRSRHIRDFFKLAEDVTSHNDISLQNVAPYIVCKLTQITSNPLLRPVLGSTRSSLDFRSIIAGRKICLVNLAKGTVGAPDCAFVGGLLSIRLAMAAQAQARIAESEREACYVYLDEFQTYATDMLSDIMAETRKYGLRLTLANQSLSQVDGDRFRANAAGGILANAASIVAFRVGVPDAERIGRWFAPEFTPQDLARLPDHHACARLLVRGRPMEPTLLKTCPPMRDRR